MIDNNNNYNQKSKHLFFFFSLPILIALFFVVNRYLEFNNIYLFSKPNQNSPEYLSVLNNYNGVIYSNESTKEQKINTLKLVRSIFDDKQNSLDVRTEAAKTLTDVFFNYGTTLSDGALKSNEFNQRGVYEIGNEIIKLNPTSTSLRLLLINAYIGLRFFKEDFTKEKVDSVLEIYFKNRFTEKDDNFCGNANKISSIFYLAEKAGFSVDKNKWGNYNDHFETAFYKACPEEKKSTVAFMWLAAISDSLNENPTSTASTTKYLLGFISSKINNPSDRLILNLKDSYFTNPQEPDTLSIVERLNIKYPEFKKFIESIK